MAKCLSSTRTERLFEQTLSQAYLRALHVFELNDDTDLRCLIKRKKKESEQETNFNRLSLKDGKGIINKY